ncbi:MAG: hypothetical protein D3910_22880 [Candidatus Electrothrix sp. ATG2]|nr:hypothetical protein [Candidatus Electrothrix sp. ATG2]
MRKSGPPMRVFIYSVNFCCPYDLRPPPTIRIIFLEIYRKRFPCAARKFKDRGNRNLYQSAVFYIFSLLFIPSICIFLFNMHAQRTWICNNPLEGGQAVLQRRQA